MSLVGPVVDSAQPSARRLISGFRLAVPLQRKAASRSSSVSSL